MAGVRKKGSSIAGYGLAHIRCYTGAKWSVYDICSWKQPINVVVGSLARKATQAWLKPWLHPTGRGACVVWLSMPAAALDNVKSDADAGVVVITEEDAERRGGGS